MTEVGGFLVLGPTLQSSKMENTYNRISKDNLKRYGTDISLYGPLLLTRLYSKRTHFIYELIQNAEDACERSRKRGDQRVYFMDFELFTDRLECRHNGIEFNDKDVEGICRIAMGTKEQDPSQIGKFGIGFKSVYAFTKSPQIYSQEKCFQIRNYVHPSPITPNYGVKKDETLIVIPFDHDNVSPGEAYQEINEKFKSLGLRTLLFLRNLNKIHWKVDSRSGTYSRSIGYKDDVTKKVHLSYKEGENKEKTENWLVFEKPLPKLGEKIFIDVAFQLGKTEKSSTEKIIPATNTYLVVFFPTEKVTNLKFLIQGQYHTTPARDNIYSEDWNTNLIKETARLVVETFPTLKRMGLCDVSFLNSLPIETELFPDDNIFRPVYDAVKEKLQGEEAFLPCSGGEHVAAEHALIAGSKELRGLLSPAELEILFGIKAARWIDKNITNEKTPILKTYLTNELDIGEITSDKFATAFSDDFVKGKDDDWMKKFYAFLSEQRSLWKKTKSYWEGKDGVLRSKPIIRLEDDLHTQPFGEDEEPLAYLPSNFSKLYPTVKSNIAKDEKAREFLIQLGLKEPDEVAGVLRKILPEYKRENQIVSEKDNKQHLELIAKALKSVTALERKKILLDKLSRSRILWADNVPNSKHEYKKPTEVYLGQEYTDNRDVETYFSANAECWLLNSRYVSMNIGIFKEIGCASEIRVTYKKAGQDKNVTITDYHGQHARGLDEFDPKCEIDGLETALKSIDIEKAKIIWSILKSHYKRIHGTVEESTRQDYSGSTREEKYSEMGRLLHDSKWLPDINGDFHNPAGLSLSNLHRELDNKSFEARYVAKELGLLTTAEEALLEDLPEERRALIEQIRNAPEEMIAKIQAMLTTPQSAGAPEEVGPETSADHPISPGKVEWLPVCKPEEAEIDADTYAQIQSDIQQTAKDAEAPQNAPLDREEEAEDELSQDAKNAIGKWGEEFALRVLDEKLSSKYPGGTRKPTENGFSICIGEKTVATVNWLNKFGERGEGYDIEVIENDGRSYIEVKSTKTACKEWFEISRKQWDCATQNGDKYHVYRIFNAGTAKAKLRDICNPSKLFIQGLISAQPVRIWI